MIRWRNKTILRRFLAGMGTEDIATATGIPLMKIEAIIRNFAVKQKRTR